MATVKFAKGTQVAYDALMSKDSGTLYFITDITAPALYLGELKLSSVAELAAALTRIGTNETDIASLKSALSGIDLATKGSVKAAIEAVQTATNTTIGSLESLTTTSKTDVVSAINEVKKAVDDVATTGAITIDTAKTTAGYAKSYTIKQGENQIGVIDIPKDLVVTEGKVIVATASGNKFVDGEGNEVAVTAAGTYIQLTVANQDAPIFINVKNLVDAYTAAADATQVQLAVNGYTLSATLVAGGVGTTELADDAVTTAKIADANVTKAKLSTELQASIDKADNAVQSVVEGTANGTISVDGTDVNVHGLGSAAYTDSTAYDASGAAAAVLGTSADVSGTATVYGVKADVAAALGSASDTKDANTVYGAKAAAADAETNAKKYTDDSLTWGPI